MFQYEEHETSRYHPVVTWRRVLAVLAGILLIHITAIIVLGFQDAGQPADVAVIFGSKVDPGGTPSLSLERRLQKGLELYRKHLVPLVIVSGGLGKEGYQEADVMRDYLIQRGVPDAAIIRDPNGNTTRLTALHTKAIMRQRRLHSVIAVSQYYHIVRCELALKQAGIQNVTGAHADYRIEKNDPISLVREVVGLYAYLLGRGD